MPEQPRRQVCPKCGAVTTGDFDSCLRCQEPFTAPEPPPAPRPASAPVPSPPPLPASAPAPLYAPPAPVPVYAPAPVPSRPRSGAPVLAVVLLLVGLLVLVGLAVGGYLVWQKLRPAVMTPEPVKTETTAPATSTQTATASGPSLDDFVGSWEFVGEPGPWGEGAPVVLERQGDTIIGTAGLPDWDEKIRLELALKNGDLAGESISTQPDGSTVSLAVSFELDEGKSLMTVRYEVGGEWMTRVAKRQDQGSQPTTSSSAPSAAGPSQVMIRKASKLRGDMVSVEQAGDWAFADVADKDGQGNWATSTAVLTRRVSGQWEVVAVGDSMDWGQYKQQMSPEEVKAFNTWDAGHY